VATWVGGPWVKFNLRVGIELTNAWPKREREGEILIGTVEFRRPIPVDSQIGVEWTVLTRLYDQRSVDVLTRSRLDRAAQSEWMSWRVAANLRRRTE
jgi:hypothetical protein